jgi:hypothetical protein
LEAILLNQIRGLFIVRKYITLCGAVLSFSFLAQAENVTVKAWPSNSGAVNGVASICDGVAGNLVLNCGFETGDFTSWARSGDPSFTGISAAAANSGTSGLLTGPNVSLGFITQTLSTAADQTYSLTFYLRNSGRPNRYTVSWNGTIVSDQTDVADFPYVAVTIDGLVATGDSTDLTFGFFNPPDYFWFDDVSVVAN